MESNFLPDESFVLWFYNNPWAIGAKSEWRFQYRQESLELKWIQEKNDRSMKFYDGMSLAESFSEFIKRTWFNLDRVVVVEFLSDDLAIHYVFGMLDGAKFVMVVCCSK